MGLYMAMSAVSLQENVFKPVALRLCSDGCAEAETGAAAAAVFLAALALKVGSCSRRLAAISSLDSWGLGARAAASAAAAASCASASAAACTIVRQQAAIPIFERRSVS